MLNKKYLKVSIIMLLQVCENFVINDYVLSLYRSNSLLLTISHSLLNDFFIVRIIPSLKRRIFRFTAYLWGLNNISLPGLILCFILLCFLMLNELLTQIWCNHVRIILECLRWPTTFNLLFKDSLFSIGVISRLLFVNRD